MKPSKKKLAKTAPTLLEHLKRNKTAYRVYLALLAVTGAVALRSAFIGQWKNLFLACLAALLYLIPPLVEKTARVTLPTGLETVALVFVFASAILGEIANFYALIPLWDSLLHAVCGFMFAAFGFSLADILNRPQKSRTLSPLFLAFVAFSFAMTVGVLWEFFEFSVDTLFHKDMQKDTLLYSVYSVRLDPERKNRAVILDKIVRAIITLEDGSEIVTDGYLDIGLVDTMKDLFVNFIGATVFCLIGFFTLQKKNRSPLAESFIPKTCEKPPYDSDID